MSREYSFWEAVERIRERNTAYSPEAYGFVMDALEFTVHRIGHRRHVSGAELLEHMCEHARQSYGLMAYTVLEKWGLVTTNDVGRVVFELVDANVLAKQDGDTPSDFDNVFDMREILEDAYFDQ